jgi:hypothetical protein
MRARHRARAAVNVVNLSTPLGLLIALIGAGRLERGPRGLVYARGYRLPVPPAPAFTVGNVILFRLGEDDLGNQPELLAHEERHTTQYAWSLGPVMILLYVLVSGVSWALSGCPACYNPYERLADLAEGGYERHYLRFPSRTWPGSRSG